MAEMTGQMWEIAHALAADLALNRVSKNLVQQTADYLRNNPQATLSDYLLRLEQLGDAFAGGKSGQFERKDLRRVLERVVRWPRSVDKTLLTLGWIARLVEYYAQHPEEASQRSGLAFLPLRPGAQHEGIVRERQKEQVWIALAPGQWGSATRKFDAEIGDRVRANVLKVESPVRFTVDIVEVVERATPPPSRPPRPPAQQPAPRQPTESEEAAREDRISQAARSFYESMRGRAEQEEGDGK